MAEVLRLAGEFKDPDFDPFRVKIVKAHHPLAQAALEMLRRFAGGRAIRLRDRNFGGVGVDEIYI